ncbi:hypothetical protein T10_8872 [Trichinella papuae]|uniref:Uncharacterized protein n=1 Tax=Trichinella papuae TaxID=268474 RepID=A0A0V1MH04_9BILA|nr:hypothetical protein T10_8872 [Trichinella papuae]
MFNGSSSGATSVAGYTDWEESTEQNTVSTARTYQQNDEQQWSEANGVSGLTDGALA